MPDQSSAADEHALMQEVTAPLEKLPDDPVPIASDVNFPLALRGYDRIAVDAYVRKTTELVTELQATRSPDSVVRRALERVGDEVSGILQRAHETSERITSQSRREAEDRLERAREEASKIVEDAQNRLKDLDSETDRIWAERQQIVEDTRELARQLLVLADGAAERFPAAEEQAAGPAEHGDEALHAAAAEDDEALEPDDFGEQELAEAPEHGAESAHDEEDFVEHGADASEGEAPVEHDAESADGGAHEADAEAEHPVAGDVEHPDNETTAVLPSVRPAEPGEEHE